MRLWAMIIYVTMTTNCTRGTASERNQAAERFRGGDDGDREFGPNLSDEPVATNAAAAAASNAAFVCDRRKNANATTFTLEERHKTLVDTIIDALDRLQVLTAQTTAGCFSLGSIKKLESLVPETNQRRVEIYMVFDEIKKRGKQEKKSVNFRLKSPKNNANIGEQINTGLNTNSASIKECDNITTKVTGFTNKMTTEDPGGAQNSTNLLGQFNQDVSSSGGPGSIGLTKTQIMVISTCSTVIGLFFIVAAIMRVRNYLKRQREEQAMARRPTFRSCSVALRNANTPAANNHDNAKQTPEMTPDRCNQESQLQDDEHEANPLLKTASSSAPPSPSFVTDQKCELIKQSSYDLEYMEYEEDGLLKSSAILEDIREIGEGNTPGITCSLELDKLQDGRNCYNNNTEASFYGNGYSADCGELPNLRDLQIYNTALCLTQSDTSVSSSLDNYSYCYGNQMEYTCDVGGCCRDDYRPYRAATPPKVLPHAPCLTRQHPVDEFLTMDTLQVPHDSRQFNLVSSSSSSDSLNNEGDYLDSSSDEMYPLYNKESISEKLNEMCDDLFDDMLLDNRASIADLNEFDNLVLSLPTIPEGSIEYTDSDLETKGLNECDSISSSHWNNAFDQCDGNADESNIDNRKPDIVSSVKTPPGGGGDNQAFIVESESVDDDEDEEECVGINNRTGTDERTLLLSSFEGMESTLV